MSDKDAMDRRTHWEAVHRTKDPTRVSWYETEPSRSLAAIRACALEPKDPILDVGAGSSFLVDHLLEEGFQDISVLDVSEAALARSRERLGVRGDPVSWITSDVTAFEADKPYALWHDRAVFHFLTDEEDQAAYRRSVEGAVRPGGWVVMAGFAPDGPIKCSGLYVRRTDAIAMGRTLGSAFRLVEEARHVHTAPAGVKQSFTWARFRREDSSA